eukprot:1971642-Prymnesium_polylepis.2
MFRTLYHTSVQRSLRATFSAFPSADVYTVIGVSTKLETYRGYGKMSSNDDVKNIFEDLVNPKQSVVHHQLSANEEAWTRCKSTIMPMYHKIAICLQHTVYAAAEYK